MPRIARIRRRAAPRALLLALAALVSAACGGGAGGAPSGAGAGGAGGATGASASQSDATSSSATTGGVCTPGAPQPCYSGPPGTEGVGACRAGTATCNPEGTALGACEGEVLPSVDSCATADDEDCDGVASPCPGDALWSKRFGDAALQRADCVAADANGNVLFSFFATSSTFFFAHAGSGPVPCAVDQWIDAMVTILSATLRVEVHY